MDDQRDHWNRTSRTYGFKLALPQINPTRTYVLSATFEREGGGRFFDKIVIEAPPDLRNPLAPAHEEPRPRAPKN
jgi:hypothetical protein